MLASMTAILSWPCCAQAEPLSAVPNFGGHDSQGSTGFRILGDGPVPTPRELVAQLDQYVIGQDQAKRVSSTGALSMTCHGI